MGGRGCCDVNQARNSLCERRSLVLTSLANPIRICDAPSSKVNRCAATFRFCLKSARSRSLGSLDTRHFRSAFLLTCLAILMALVNQGRDDGLRWFWFEEGQGVEEQRFQPFVGHAPLSWSSITTQYKVITLNKS